MQAFLQGVIIGAANATAGPGVPLVGAGAGAQFASIWGCVGRTRNDGGRTRVEAFWWGFHVQLSHADLITVLDSADTVNDLVAVVGGNIPSPAQPWIRLIAPFVTTTHAALRALDRGQGIYISMSWVAPGMFVPTSV